MRLPCFDSWIQAVIFLALVFLVIDSFHINRFVVGVGLIIIAVYQMFAQEYNKHHKVPRKKYWEFEFKPSKNDSQWVMAYK